MFKRVDAIASFFRGRRFRPSSWPTLAMIVFIAVTVSLGNWQRHRANDKRVLQGRLEDAAREPPLNLVSLPQDAATVRFREVRVEGVFDADHQVLIDNKVHGGRPGYDVVTPLRLAVGNDAVLVDRGWVAQGARRSELPSVQPPPGRVSIQGRANLPPARYLELGNVPQSGPVRQNLDIGRIAASFGLSLAPFVIEQTNDNKDGLVRDWPAPDFGAEQNLSYMMQWYTFAALSAVLWLTLNWRLREVRE